MRRAIDSPSLSRLEAAAFQTSVQGRRGHPAYVIHVVPNDLSRHAGAIALAEPRIIAALTSHHCRNPGAFGLQSARITRLYRTNFDSRPHFTLACKKTGISARNVPTTSTRALQSASLVSWLTVSPPQPPESSSLASGTLMGGSVRLPPRCRPGSTSTLPTS